MAEATPIRDEQVPTREEIAEVADTLGALMRSFAKARARMLASADVEWSAHVVLKCLAHDGPIRASALAGRIHADPSTVSRQVAAMVRDGLIERRADPEDGRASLLVPTAKAASVLAAHDEVRLQHFRRMLADWSPRDLRRFAALLRRFTTDFETANDQRAPQRAASAEGNG